MAVPILMRAVFGLLVLLVAIACCVVLTPISYILFLTGELPAYRLLLGIIQSLFCTGCATAIEVCLDSRIVMSLDDSLSAKSGVSSIPGISVLLCNHPTRLDWMYVWAAMATSQTPIGLSIPELRIVLKGELKKAPLLGWFMQQNNYMFLRRNFEADKHHLAAMSAHVARQSIGVGPQGGAVSAAAQIVASWVRGDPTLRDHPIQRACWLIFPEGSDANRSKVEQGRTKAAFKGLVQQLSLRPEYPCRTLLPRRRGVAALLRAAEGPHIIARRTPWQATPGEETSVSTTSVHGHVRVIDAMMAYRGVFPRTEASTILRGHSPTAACLRLDPILGSQDSLGGESIAGLARAETGEFGGPWESFYCRDTDAAPSGLEAALYRMWARKDAMSDALARRCIEGDDVSWPAFEDQDGGMAGELREGKGADPAGNTNTDKSTGAFTKTMTKKKKALLPPLPPGALPIMHALGIEMGVTSAHEGTQHEGQQVGGTRSETVQRTGLAVRLCTLTGLAGIGAAFLVFVCLPGWWGAVARTYGLLYVCINVSVVHGMGGWDVLELKWYAADLLPGGGVGAAIGSHGALSEDAHPGPKDKTL